MLTIDVKLPIGPESENRWMAMWGEENVFFSLDTMKRILDENPDEKDIKLNFNCDGGYVDEGFAIYDCLRTSGRNIHCNIESGCHSMAVVLLLAAPKENRTANKHAMSLIHCVRSEVWDELTADELRAAADEMEMRQEKILDIYADRTGSDKDELRVLMKEEKTRDAQFLLDHGFIGKINQYNTNCRKSGVKSVNNKNKKDMAKTKQEVLNMADKFLSGLKNLLGTATNYDHTDADGNVLFSTEAEDETLEVGMTASPDGTFELPDGRTVVIADGAITEINEPQTTASEEELENLRSENENLRNQLAEAANVINELQAQLTTNYTPQNTKRTTPARKPAKNVVEDEDAAANAIRNHYNLKNKED